MNKPTLLEIKNTMLSLKMKVFSAPFDMTLAGIRTKDNKANTFNDWLFMLYHDATGKLCGTVEKGTTDAGLYYRLNPMQINGTAIIQHSIQHRGSYTYMEKGGHRGQEAFRQTQNICPLTSCQARAPQSILHPHKKFLELAGALAQKF